MALPPDLVQDSRLSTHLHGPETIHTYLESDPSSGKRVVAKTEHWQRHGKIGNGAYGSVWLEECIKGERGARFRAVKQISLDSRSGPVDYTRELEAIAKFSSSNYVRCFVKSFGWYEHSGNLCIAMEYLEQGDLQHYLDHSSSPLSEDETMEITFQVLEGLDMMHENSFAHRDLKLQNILVQSHPPSTWWVKLADFGISKRIEEASGGSTLHGTPGYIAPEIWNLTARGSPYAPDIWALGETTFRLLTNRPAFPNIASIKSYMSDLDAFPVKVLQSFRTTQLGIEFVRSLLHPLPASRPTASDAISHKWIKRMIFEIPDPKSSLVIHAGQENHPIPFASMSDQYASVNTKISMPEMVARSAKALLPMRTLTERNAEPNAAGSSGPEFDEAESNVGITEATEFSAHHPHSVGSSTSIGRLRLSDKHDEHSDRTSYITISPDGETLMTAADGMIRSWTIYSPTERIRYRTSTMLMRGEDVHELAFSPDGKYLASGSQNRVSGIQYIYLWDVPDFLRRTQLAGSRYIFREHTKHLCFSPDSTLLASGDSAGKIHVWRLDDVGSPVYQTHCEKLLGLTFRQNGDLLIMHSTGIQTQRFTSNYSHQFTFPDKISTSRVIFSSDGSYFVYRVSDFPRFEFRATASGKLIRQLHFGVYDKILSMALSPDGHIIALTVYNRKNKASQIILCNVVDGKELQAIPTADTSTVLAFSPDSQLLISGNIGGFRSWGNDVNTDVSSAS